MPLTDEDEAFLEEIGKQLTGPKPTEMAEEVLSYFEGKISDKLRQELLSQAERAETGDETCLLQFRLMRIRSEPKIAARLEELDSGTFLDMLANVVEMYAEAAVLVACPEILRHTIIVQEMAYLLGRYDERQDADS
jgi:hypothetical protein